MRDGAFRPIQTSQKYAGRFADLVGNHRAFLQFEFKRGPHQLLRHVEQLLSQGHQLVCRQPAMALLRCLGQRIGNPCANPDRECPEPSGTGYPS
jgi:hypothetical protein